MAQQKSVWSHAPAHDAYCQNRCNLVFAHRSTLLAVVFVGEMLARASR
jgi:hypothetical protein